MRAMIRRAMLSMVLAPTVLVACEATDCRPTATTAHDASIGVAPDVARSGVLVARLTTGDDVPLRGKKITFSIEDSAVFGDETLGSATTGTRGDATLDLKDRPVRLAKAATVDEYTATFAGDPTYCPSDDTAVIDLARVE